MKSKKFEFKLSIRPRMDDRYQRIENYHDHELALGVLYEGLLRLGKVKEPTQVYTKSDKPYYMKELDMEYYIDIVIAKAKLDLRKYNKYLENKNFLSPSEKKFISKKIQRDKLERKDMLTLKEKDALEELKKITLNTKQNITVKLKQKKLYDAKRKTYIINSTFAHKT